jgi:hypothetical protein
MSGMMDSGRGEKVTREGRSQSTDLAQEGNDAASALNRCVMMVLIPAGVYRPTSGQPRAANLGV